MRGYAMVLSPPQELNATLVLGQVAARTILSPRLTMRVTGQNTDRPDLSAARALGQELLNAVYKPLGTIPKRDAADPLETTPSSSLRVPLAGPGGAVITDRQREDRPFPSEIVERLEPLVTTIR